MKWARAALVGVVLGVASAVLFFAGMGQRSSNGLLMLSVLLSVVACFLFLVGLIGYFVTRSRVQASR